MSNVFKVCPTHFSRGGEKLSRGCFTPLRPPGYGPGCRKTWEMLQLWRQIRKAFVCFWSYWFLIGPGFCRISNGIAGSKVEGQGWTLVSFTSSLIKVISSPCLCELMWCCTCLPDSCEKLAWANNKTFFQEIINKKQVWGRWLIWTMTQNLADKLQLRRKVAISIAIDYCCRELYK